MDKAGCSSFCSRCVETSTPKAPVSTCHSHTALPRSSNLTRPVDLSPVSFFEDGRSAPLGAGWATGFDFSLLTIPFYAMQELSQARGFQKRRNVTFTRRATSHLQLMLSPPQRHGRFTVVPFALEDMADGLLQGQPPEFQFLVRIGAGRSHLKVAREIQVDHLGEDSRRRNVEPQRSPAICRHAGFLLKFTHCAHRRLLAGIEFSRGNLPQEVLDAMPVLTHDANPIRSVDGHHRGCPRVAHVIVVVFATVRVAQPLGRYLDDAAAVRRDTGHNAGFLHESLPKSQRIRGIIAESRATV